MRIRKRCPPLLSDPQLNSPRVVQQLKHENDDYQENTKIESSPSDLSNLAIPQPSDQLGFTWCKPNNLVLFGSNSNQDKYKAKELGVVEEKERAKEESFGSSNDNHSKKESFSSPQGSLMFPQLASSSHLDRKQCEGDKATAFRETGDDSYNSGINKETMKSRANKKFPHEEGLDKSSHKIGANERKMKGSVILEGSRCSRVNGRGWRCCQQTLVGYSLCEYHLGKGRLRSTASVRNATSSKKKKQAGEKTEDKSLSNDDDKNLKPVMVTRNKNTGMVKARSLSSLLGQAGSVVATSVVNDNIE